MPERREGGREGSAVSLSVLRITLHFLGGGAQPGGRKRERDEPGGGEGRGRGGGERGKWFYLHKEKRLRFTYNTGSLHS